MIKNTDESLSLIENSTNLEKSHDEINLLKKRKRNKNKNSFKNLNNSKIRELMQITNTGNIIFKEISNKFSIGDGDGDENKLSCDYPSKPSLFITRIKEVDFKTDDSLFKKGRLLHEKINFIENDPYDHSNISSHNTPNINFWLQRYYYFSKFDDGIKLDYESWYSVTPEEISVYIAKLCNSKTVVDAFCGSGGNTIQFSKLFEKVYAVDIDPSKIELCKNNLEVYQCGKNVEFINLDYLNITNVFPELKSDCVFLSPPWGGMDYKSTEQYSLRKWVTPDIKEIIKVSLNISENLIFYLPRNTDIEELFSIISEVYKNEENDPDDPTLYAEVQLLKSADKIKAILVLFGKKYNTMSIKDIRKYLISIYKNIEEYQLCQLVNLAKVMGVSRFFYDEYNYRKGLFKTKRDSNMKIKINKILKVFKEEKLTNDELSEFNTLNNMNKNNSKIKNNNVKNLETYFKTNQIPNISQIMSSEQYDNIRKNII